ncbi:YadA-like family protein [Acinetobacter guillouiae]|uniref:YadA-like family protein n=1 Tax=Acinetobacter guillouiae TaxID=106649 RepID=UPI003AF449B0
MNKVYKIVWNESLGTWCAISEVSKTRGKRSSAKTTVAGALLVVSALTMSGMTAAADNYVSVNDGGTQSGNYNNDGAVASGSVVIGPDSSSIGASGVAIGNNADVTGLQGVAIGNNAQAGYQSIALGFDTVATAFNSMALGNRAIAYTDGTTLGQGTYANKLATAMGNGALAVGQESTAYGYSALAGTDSFSQPSAGTDPDTIGKAYATAMGSRAKASAQGSTAVGAGSVAEVDNGLALGANSVANTGAGVAGYVPTSANQSQKDAINATQSTLGAVSVGSVGNTRQITNVAAGTTDTDAVNVAQLKAVQSATETHYVSVNDGGVQSGNYNNDGALGKNSVVIGMNSRTTVDGTNSVVIGLGNVSGVDNGIAVGTGNFVNATSGGVAFGVNNSLVNFGGSTAVGMGNYSAGAEVAIIGNNNETIGSFNQLLGSANKTPSGAYQSILGYGNSIEGADYNIAIGTKNNITTRYDTWGGGGRTIAIGHNNNIDGIGSGLFGQDAMIKGNGSFSFGNSNKVTNNESTALGLSNNISGTGVYALGANNIVAQNNTFVIGNKVTTTQDNSVVLGNESTDRAATTIDKVTINGEDYTVAGAGSVANGIVSVGKVGAERQIINVASGEVSATSTDAVNGSQLYSTNQAVEKLSAGQTHYVSINDDGTQGNNYNNDGATGKNALAVGVGASATGESAIAIGLNAGANNDGGGNISVGSNSGQNIKGYLNTALGYAAGRDVTGNKNTGLGFDAGGTVTGDSNLAVGDSAGAKVRGSSNTALGKMSGFSVSGSANTATGLDSGNGVRGSSNSAYGQMSGHSVTGDSNVAIGDTAGNNVTGNRNVALGRAAGQGLSNVDDATSLGSGAKAAVSNSVALGANSEAVRDVNSEVAYVPLGTTIVAANAAGGEVSVGTVGKERRISNVAAASQDTDAVNLSQLKAVQAATTTHYFSVNDEGTQANNYNNDGATGKNALAVGIGAKAAGENAIAIGNVTSDAANSIAIGNNNSLSNTASSSTAIGHNNNVTGNEAIALGANNTVKDFSGVAVGSYNNAEGYRSIAVGAENKTKGQWSSAFGVWNIAEGERATVLGANNTIQGRRALGMGVANEISSASEYSSAVGAFNKITDSMKSLTAGFGNTVTGGEKNSVLGNENTLNNAKNTTVLGNKNTVAQENTQVLGNNVTTTQANSVVLGNESTDRVATTIDKVTINGDDYAFAGVGAAANGVVSVGKVGGERQIINVAAGEISASSTDAVNGSQLYATNQAVEKLYAGAGDTTHYVSVNDGGTQGNNYNNDGATGKNAVAVGVGASATGENAIAIGLNAGINNDGGWNTSVGSNSGKNTKGQKNTALGDDAGRDVTGNNNTGLGMNAGVNVVGDSNLAVGDSAGGNVEGSGNTALGKMSGINVIGTANTATGQEAGSNVKGRNNSAFGVKSGINVIGEGNTAMGLLSGTDITGSYNTSVGYATGGSKGSYNNYLGYMTGLSSKGDMNSAVGPYAGQDVVGNKNTAEGYSAGINVKGDSNIALGDSAGENVTGNRNVALGRAAGQGLSNVDDTTSLGSGAKATVSNSVALGANSEAIRDVNSEVAYVPQGTTIVAANAAGGEVSVGTVGKERRITNVAAASQDTDAVNLSQLKAAQAAASTHYFSVNDGGTQGNNYKNDGATGKNALAAGRALAGGESSVAIGDGASAKADFSTAVGFLNTVTGKNSTAIGASNNVAKDNTQVLGNNVTTTQANSVVLGNASTDRVATVVDKVSINGEDYAFAGVGSTANGVVSVGKVGGERQIINVAAGEISASSTDAINGSQLYATNQAVEKLYAGAGDTTHYVSINDAGNKAGNYNNDGASGALAVALGVGASAKGDGATALGLNSSAKSKDAVAIGTDTRAELEGSVALGKGSVANTAAGIAGFDPLTGFGSSNTGSTWRSSAAAFSVGDVSRGITRQITGVAAGTTDTDAVNVAQLKAAISKSNEAKGSTETVSAGKNTEVTKTTKADGSTDYQVATKDDVSFDSVTVGNIKADSQSNTISGLADGKVSADSDQAINGSQLHDTAESVANALGGNAKVNPDGTIKTSNIGNTGKDNVHDAIASIHGQVAGAKTSVSAGKNTVVNSSTNADGSNNYQVALAEDIQLNSVTANQVTAQQVTANKVNVGKVSIDGTTNKVSGLANGEISSTSTDAINGSQLHQTNSSVAQHLGGGSTLNKDGSIGAPTYNVAGGTFHNVGDALGAIDTRVSNLEQAFYDTNKNMDDLRNDTYAGIAGAMAVGNLPQPTEAGMSMVSAGVSGYRGETAVAIGVSAITDSNKIVWKMGASADSRSNIGGAVSMGYQWK